jgi:predicted DNA binding protein
MWIAKFEVIDEGNIYGEKTKKYNVNMHYYPINHYLEKNIYYFTAIGIIDGEEKNKRNFFKELKDENKKSKIKRYVVKLEINQDFFICITAQHKTIELKKFVHTYYNPKFIHIKPAIIKNNGWEEAEIASPNKKELINLMGVGEKLYKLKLMKLKEEKIKDIGILSIVPELTDKQKHALEIAIKNGYYEYPREIELEKLAKLMKISLSTYQAHLRKAEKKLLPYIFEKYE